MPLPRIRLLIAIALFIFIASGCGASGGAAEATEPPEPTLHPTFTPTPPEPTPTPSPVTPTPPPVAENGTGTDATAIADAPTPLPEESTPTPELPTPTPQPALIEIEIVAPQVNLRGGPGTGYSRVGQVTQGQRLLIVARNSAGDWFQVRTPDGQTAWVVSDAALTRVVGDAGNVVVAANIPAPPQPTQARPQPTRAPAQPQPTAAPAVSYPFQASGPLDSPTTNQFLNVFASVRDAKGAWLEGYRLKATRSGGDAGQSELSRPGPSDATLGGDNRPQNLKYEYPNQGAADWKVWLVDGNGTQVSDVISFQTNPSSQKWIFVSFTKK